LIALQQSYLQVENWDMIITIVENWPNDSRVNCMQNKNMKDYLKIKRSLVDDNYYLIKEKKYFEKLNVHDEQCVIGIHLSHLCFFFNIWIFCCLSFIINISKFLQASNLHCNGQNLEIQLLFIHVGKNCDYVNLELHNIYTYL
jgi:hypothetical protein